MRFQQFRFHRKKRDVSVIRYLISSSIELKTLLITQTRSGRNRSPDDIIKWVDNIGD